MLQAGYMHYASFMPVTLGGRLVRDSWVNCRTLPILMVGTISLRSASSVWSVRWSNVNDSKMRTGFARGAHRLRFD